MNRSLTATLIAATLSATLPGEALAQTFWQRLKQRRHDATVEADGVTIEAGADVESETSAARNQDGSLTLRGEHRIQGDRGHVLEVGRERTVRSTEDGHAWQGQGGWGSGEAGGRYQETGSSRRGDDGATWESRKQIEGQGGRGADVESKGRWVKNPDGSMSWITDKTITRKDGTVVTEQGRLGLRKTAEGWQWDAQSTRQGPAGTSRWQGEGRAAWTGKGWDAEQRTRTTGDAAAAKARWQAAAEKWKAAGEQWKAKAAARRRGR